MNKILLMTLSLLLATDTFAAEISSWSLLDGDDGALVSLRGEIKEYPDGVELSIEKESKPLDELSLLGSYYWLLKRQEIGSVADLYTNIDGSRDKFRFSIKSNSLNLIGYKGLSSVKIMQSIKWGLLTTYTLRLTSEDNQSMDWQETVFCNKTCSLVFDLLGSNQENRFLDSIKHTFWQAQDENRLSTGKFRFSKNAIVAKVANPKTLFEGNGKIVSPLSFYVLMDDSSANEFSLDKCDKNLKFDEYRMLCDFVQSSRSVDVFDKEQVRDYFSALIEDETASIIPVNVRENEKIKRFNYVLEAYLQYLQSWDKINFLGHLTGKKEGYLIFEPILESGEAYPFQVLHYVADGSQQKILLPNQHPSLYSLFYSNLFTNSIEPHLKK